jgi:hypothetical protein
MPAPLQDATKEMYQLLVTCIHDVYVQGLRWYAQRIPASWAKLKDALRTMAQQGKRVLQWSEYVTIPSCWDLTNAYLR